MRRHQSFTVTSHPNLKYPRRPHHHSSTKLLSSYFSPYQSQPQTRNSVHQLPHNLRARSAAFKDSYSHNVSQKRYVAFVVSSSQHRVFTRSEQLDLSSPRSFEFFFDSNCTQRGISRADCYSPTCQLTLPQPPLHITLQYHYQPATRSNC